MIISFITNVLEWVELQTGNTLGKHSCNNVARRISSTTQPTFVFCLRTRYVITTEHLQIQTQPTLFAKSKPISCKIKGQISNDITLT